MDEEYLAQILEENNKDVYIFNPTKEDFTCSYDVSGDGVPVSFTLKSYEGSKYPKYIADHIAKHLKNRIVGQMSGVITETIIDDVLKEIYL